MKRLQSRAGATYKSGDLTHKKDLFIYFGDCTSVTAAEITFPIEILRLVRLTSSHLVVYNFLEFIYRANTMGFSIKIDLYHHSQYASHCYLFDF